LATEPTCYLTYAEAVLIQVFVMRRSCESQLRVDDRSLIESARTSRTPLLYRTVAALLRDDDIMSTPSSTVNRVSVGVSVQIAYWGHFLSQPDAMCRP
jgi:hypothetical protein